MQAPFGNRISQESRGAKSTEADEASVESDVTSKHIANETSKGRASSLTAENNR